jgi:hypothetical protein
VEPLFSALIVGLVPQPMQVPAPPFERDALQKVFFEVSRDFPYSQFGLLPGDQGAQLLNPPHDRVLLQPALLQVQSPIGSGTTEVTAERAREKAVRVLRVAAERLEVQHFLSCGIKVTALVPAPESGARDFVATKLFSQAERIDVLGPGFFGGGIKVWRFEDGQKVEVLLIEPLLSDDQYIYVDYDLSRTPVGAITDLDDLADWIDLAFRFVSDKTIMFLEEAS